MGDDRWCTNGHRATRGLRPRHWAPQRPFWLTMRWNRWKLTCWHQRRGGYSPVTLTTYCGTRVEKVSNFVPPGYAMKKKNVGNGGKDSPHRHLAPVESNVFDRLSQIVAHCAVTKYEDGDPRKPGWVTLKTLGSAWIVEAKDPDSAAKLTASADTLDNALALLDLLLGSEEAPWEPDQWLRQQGQKKR